jgi:hypothetical protein
MQHQRESERRGGKIIFSIAYYFMVIRDIGFSRGTKINDADCR